MMDDLEQRMRDEEIVAVNIHLDANGFRVHVRHSLSSGFHCAQKVHQTLEGALAEHFGRKNDLDLSDLLV